jgi:phage tail sheath protein FI
MAEYLSPGVFIEEIPSSLRAIDGVSTSTAAFVGRARRGTVPGYAWPGSPVPSLPFAPTGGFVLAGDPAPLLVTSFSQFQREFGPPLSLPLDNSTSDYGYLGWAVRAFFDNGGKRAFIARIVDPTDKPSTMRLAQGVAYRLVRSASRTDKKVYLTSMRGLNIGNAVTFLRRSDGQNPLGTPALPAAAVGGTAPLALHTADSITVKAGAPQVTGVWNGTAAVVRSTTASFSGLNGTTLQLRVGGPSAPLQSVTFTGLPNPATPANVVPFLSPLVAGVAVTVDPNPPNGVMIATTVAGTNAQLDVSGSAVAPLTLGAVTPGGGNVGDIAHVTIPEIAAQLLLPADIVVGDDGTGRLRIASTATGAAATVQLDEVNAGALSRLGYGAVATVTRTGSAAVSPTVTITSYDTQSNSISFAGALGVPLDAGDVYLLGPNSPTASAGPLFIARSPGSWSANVSVSISNADRSPSRVTGAVAVNQAQVPVQSVASFYVGAVVEVDHNASTRGVHQVTDVNVATRVLTLDPPLTVVITNAPGDQPSWVRTLEIDVVVTDATGAAPTEVYRGLSWNQTAGVADVRRHYAWPINANSRLVWVQPPGVGAPPLPGSEGFNLATQPSTADGFPMTPPAASTGVETFNDLDDTWIGTDNGPGQRSGIESFLDLSEARIIAAPGKTSHTIHLALIGQCELLRYRFAILDGEKDPAGGSITSILTHRNLYDTSFAAYYQPWVTVSVDGQSRYLPASGYLAGIYARVDNARGVWKAPANETVLNVSGLKTVYTTGEQDLLNPRGVNLIRQFDQGGIRVWGARTLSSDPDVKYINVRRTLIFLEASIDRGTQWVVFEPNAPETWVRVTDSVSAFLLTQWRNGALFGRKPEEAFFVRCDETTMTADDILNGRLVCHIGVAIVRPAEFVIFRIEQITKFGAKA